MTRQQRCRSAGAAPRQPEPARLPSQCPLLRVNRSFPPAFDEREPHQPIHGVLLRWTSHTPMTRPAPRHSERRRRMLAHSLPPNRSTTVPHSVEANDVNARVRAAAIPLGRAGHRRHTRFAEATACVYAITMVASSSPSWHRLATRLRVPVVRNEAYAPSGPRPCQQMRPVGRPEINGSCCRVR